MKQIHLTYLALTLFGAAHLQGNVRMPALFSDHMVLQRDMPLPVWGWASPGEQVTVGIAGQTKTALPDESGKWMVRLDPLKVGGEPKTMIVQGKNTINIHDVLVGEVWMGNGQSNMDFPMAWKGEENIAAATTINDPQLRYFDIPHNASLKPLTDVPAHWQLATPDNVKNWSAICTYMGLNFREKLKIPVAFIKSAYGGTPAAPWVSLEALNKDPAWKATAEKEIEATTRAPQDLKDFPGKMDAWMAQNGAADTENTDSNNGWAAPDFGDSAWKEVINPTTPAKQGYQGGGIFWFRRSFDLPASAAHDFDLVFNSVNEGAMTLYFNGTELKATPVGPKFLKIQPRFHVSKSLVKPNDKNVVAIRLHALTPNGSFTQSTAKMGLPVDDSKSLDEKWKFQMEKEFPPVTSTALTALPQPPSAVPQYTSSCLFNAMINPLIPYAIKGAVWYQGESNTNNAELATDYRRLLPALITDWRARWGQGDFPFFVVQLANFGMLRPPSYDSNWALVRESQAIAANTVKNSGLATAIDIGAVEDIHPNNKKEISRRLTLLALYRIYGENIEDTGPTYQAMKVQRNSIEITFTHLGGGLEAKGGELKQFAIAAEDKKFVAADAKIVGDTVVVSSSQVPVPAYVRYAWADDPDGCNLYGKNGLPAFPFRTDTP